jgi:hypothetical protein
VRERENERKREEGEKERQESDIESVRKRERKIEKREREREREKRARERISLYTMHYSISGKYSKTCIYFPTVRRRHRIKKVQNFSSFRCLRRSRYEKNRISVFVPSGFGCLFCLMRKTSRKRSHLPSVCLVVHP